MPLLRLPFGDANLVLGLEIPALHPAVLRTVWHIDNADGTASAAATGTLGTANVHSDTTWTDLDGDHTVTGDLQIVVVAGLAERATIVAGPPEEVTP